MNIRFYMFGVPDGFDIYQETSDFEVVNYFQCFYDETIKENTRLVIHRKANSEVSYTYLKYHLSSAEDRKGSFIGLSVVFSGGYYADTSSLYNLLEHAYNGMLQRGVILRPTAQGGSAIYQTRKFDHAYSEVKRVEALVLNTLNSEEYASEFTTWDNSFALGKPNTQLRIPFQIYNENPEKEQALNLLIVQRLREYSWLSLSPDYIVEPTPTSTSNVNDVELDEFLDPKTKSRYKDDFEGYQKDVLSAFSEYVSKANDNLNEKVNSLSSDIRNILLLLNKYVKKQSGLDKLLEKYKGLSCQLDELVAKLTNNPSNSVSGTSTKEGKESNDTPKDDGMWKGGKWKSVYVAIGVLLLAVCIYACFLHPIMFPVKPVDNNTDTTSVEFAKLGTDMGSEPEPQETEKPKLEELVDQFRQALQHNDFATAGECYANLVNREAESPILRDLEQELEEKYDIFISGHDFESANKMLRECLSRVYSNISINERTLKDSFRSYVRANKGSFEKKTQLIQQINLAKNGGYGYNGIDNDLRDVRALMPPTPSQESTVFLLALYVGDDNIENSLSDGRKYSSNDTIVLNIGTKYRIKNMNHVENARFHVDEKQMNRYDAFPKEQHSIQLRAQNASCDGNYTEFQYKQNGKILFVIKVRFKNPTEEESDNDEIELRRIE